MFDDALNARNVADVLETCLGSFYWLFTDPVSEDYWVYFISSFALCWMAYAGRSGWRDTWPALRQDLFPRGAAGRKVVWADCKYFYVTSWVWMWTAQPLLDTVSHSRHWAWSGWELLCGPHPTTGAPQSYAVLAGVSLAGFAAMDLAFYLVHRLFHQVPWLWAFHRTHHAPTELWFLTNSRDHVVEALCVRFAETLAAGLLMGTLSYWGGLPLNTEPLDVVIFYALFAFGRLLGHSRLWVHFGPHLNRVFISPAHHQLHHSLAPEHQNKNFGSLLAFWDLMGKSLVVPVGKPILQFGLPPNEPKTNEYSVLSMYLDPFIELRRQWQCRRQSRVQLTAQDATAHE